MTLRKLPLSIGNTLLLWRTNRKCLGIHVTTPTLKPQIKTSGWLLWEYYTNTHLLYRTVGQTLDLWFILQSCPQDQAEAEMCLTSFSSLSWSFHSFTAVSWGHLLNKSLPFKPLAMGQLLENLTSTGGQMSNLSQPQARFMLQARKEQAFITAGLGAKFECESLWHLEVREI